MNVYNLSHPLPKLPRPPTIINMKACRDGVYAAANVMSIPDFVSTLTLPMRMMYNGIRRGVPPGLLAAYLGFPGDTEKFKTHLRQFHTVFTRYWGRSYNEFVFDW